jgi:hypothetical protein
MTVNSFYNYLTAILLHNFVLQHLLYIAIGNQYHNRQGGLAEKPCQP